MSNRWRRAVVKRWLVLFIVVGVTSCTREGAAWGTPGVVHVATNVEVHSLVPEFAFDQVQIDLAQLYTQPLVGISTNNRAVPVLCTEVPSVANGGISPDGRTITYHLRRDVRFADGVPFTSADVAFTYRAILDPSNPVNDTSLYRRVSSLETPDRWTVRIRLRAPWPEEPRELFVAGTFLDAILPAHAFHGTVDLARSDWAQHPFGTGPFRVESWTRSENIVLTPNPYARPQPRLREVIVDFVPDDNAALIGLLNHSEDVAQLDELQVLRVRSTRGIRIVRQTFNGVTSIEFNVKSPRLSTVAARRAVAESIDRRAILRDAYHGLLSPATTELSPVLPEYDRSIAGIPYDPAAARSYFRSHPVGTLELGYIPNGIDNNLAVMLQAELRAVGVNVAVHAYPESVFFDRSGPLFEGKFDLAILAYIGGLDPIDSELFRCADAAPVGSDLGRFCDRAYDAAYARASSDLDPAAGRAAFFTMQRAMVDRVALVPLAVYTLFYGVNPSLRNFSPNMLFIYSNATQWEMNPK